MNRSPETDLSSTASTVRGERDDSESRRGAGCLVTKDFLSQMHNRIMQYGYEDLRGRKRDRAFRDNVGIKYETWVAWKKKLKNWEERTRFEPSLPNVVAVCTNLRMDLATLSANSRTLIVASMATDDSHQDAETSSGSSAQLSPEVLADQLLHAAQIQQFAVNLLEDQVPPDSANEGVILIKPGGTLFRPCLVEIIERLQQNCRVLQLRLYDGPTIDVKKLFDEQYRPPTMIANGELSLTESDKETLADLYDNDTFLKLFGTRYDENLLEPALKLSERLNLCADELTDLWNQGRHKELFHTNRINGINKIGYQKTVYAIRLPHQHGSGVRLVLNGYIPGYRAIFTRSDARVVAIHVATRRDWQDIRDRVVGGNSNPEKCREGTIRYDAADGLLPLHPNDNLVNGQRNVCHCSATLLDGMNEVMIWFDRKAEETLVGKTCMTEGISCVEVVDYIRRHLWDWSWKERSSKITSLVCELRRPRVIEEIRNAGPRRVSLREHFAQQAKVNHETVDAHNQSLLENAVRFEIAERDYYADLMSRQLADPSREVFNETIREIDGLAGKLNANSRSVILAEAYRIAFSDLCYLNLPLYDRAAASPALFRSQAIAELPQEALACAERTQRNLIRDLQAMDNPSSFRPKKAQAIGKTGVWKELVGSLQGSGKDARVDAEVIEGASLVAIVLCGGRSTRMSSTIPKPAIPVEGLLMLDKVIENVRQAMSQCSDGGWEGDLAVFAATGFRRELLKRVFGSRVRYLECGDTLGPGFRTAAALKSLAHYSGPVLLTYVDMPLVPAEPIRKLLSQLRQAKDLDHTFGLLTASPRSGLSGHIIRKNKDIGRIVQQRLEPDGSPTRLDRDVGVYLFPNTEEFRTRLLQTTNDNVRGEYIFADVVEKLAQSGWMIVEERIDTHCAVGINTASDLLRAIAELENDKRPDIADVRSRLEENYGIKIDERHLNTLVREHCGPLFCFPWWESQWLEG